jgi:HAD superfamily hydrolase (TIGR01509 family)
MKFVFDFGRVLFEWQPQRLLRRALPHIVHDEASAAHWEREFFQGYGGDWGAFDRGAIDSSEATQRIAARTGLATDDVQRVVDAVPHELQPIPDSVALLRQLRDAGHALYFLSNMPAPYADHLAATHEFIGWFRDGIFSGHVQLAKPEAAIFELAQQRFAARPDELMFLDDHRPNVLAARAQGWHAIEFTHAAQAAAELGRTLSDGQSR